MMLICFDFAADRFGQFDYGPENERHYNATSPPSYNLSSIQVPITLFYAENDLLANPKVSDYSSTIYFFSFLFFLCFE